jgi:high-affinity iron transporter
MFNITPQPSVLELLAWVLYLVPALVLFLWPARKPAPQTTPA